MGYFLEKTLADQNVKMVAIFQDGRHFDTKNKRFWKNPDNCLISTILVSNHIFLATGNLSFYFAKPKILDGDHFLRCCGSCRIGLWSGYLCFRSHPHSLDGFLALVLAMEPDTLTPVLLAAVMGLWNFDHIPYLNVIKGWPWLNCP